MNAFYVLLFTVKNAWFHTIDLCWGNMKKLGKLIIIFCTDLSGLNIKELGCPPKKNSIELFQLILSKTFEQTANIILSVAKTQQKVSLTSFFHLNLHQSNRQKF